MNVSHVLDAHDIHIFEVGRNPVCTAHVTMESCPFDVYSCTLKACREVILDKFHIEHATIQVEIQGEFDHKAEKYGRLHDHDMCCN
jgi:cobalt-zinc-cadmium efflux system protein